MSPEMVSEHFKAIIESIGEDPNRPGLVGTPNRAAKALQFLTQGYQLDLEAIVNSALFAADTDELVIVKDIELYSLCEHHLLPFMGKCHIGYIPNGQVLGLSKFARIVDLFGRRLQIQETLTRQIADAVQSVTGAKGVGVIIEASHLCMLMRGVEKQNATMQTSVMLGLLRKNPATRNEFLQLLKR